jgi:hypothetical protein
MIDLSKKKISPTLYKMLDHFEADRTSGEGKVCGLIIREILAGNIPEEDLDKEAFRFGAYFEYICTGAYSERKGKPEPERTGKGEIVAAYQQLDFLQHHYKLYYDYVTLVLGWKWVRTGYKYNNHDEATGIEDIVFVKPDGIYVIVDLKLSALYDDDYKPFGWGLKRLEEKPNLIIQAPWYKLLFSLEEGGQMPIFQFWVFNRQATQANGKQPYKIIEVEVEQARLESLKININGIYNYFHKKFLKFKDSELAKPSFENCYGCPANNCFYRENFPNPNRIVFLH